MTRPRVSKTAGKQRRRAAIVEAFGGLGALLGFVLSAQAVMADSSAAACKTVATTTAGVCLGGEITAALVPLAASTVGGGFVGLLLGVLTARVLIPER